MLVFSLILSFETLWVLNESIVDIKTCLQIESMQYGTEVLKASGLPGRYILLFQGVLVMRTRFAAIILNPNMG